ncbi:MAG: biotin transporter BioY [Firmicutes bacterium]|nr:biotin transporter BioY [Bacillota bacterium]
MSKISGSTKNISYIAMCTALITVCAWIAVPSVVPFTLQTFAVAAAGGLLGAKRGTLSVLIYILLGAIGLPVFASFKSGAEVILGATGGYVIGFLFLALISGFAAERFGRKMRVLIPSMLAGVAVCYAFGTVWYICIYSANTGSIGIISVLLKCVFPFIIPDIIKIMLAALCVKKLIRFVK